MIQTIKINYYCRFKYASIQLFDTRTIPPAHFCTTRKCNGRSGWQNFKEIGTCSGRSALLNRECPFFWRTGKIGGRRVARAELEFFGQSIGQGGIEVHTGL